MICINRIRTSIAALLRSSGFKSRPDNQISTGPLIWCGPSTLHNDLEVSNQAKEVQYVFILNQILSAILCVNKHRLSLTLLALLTFS